MKNHKQILEEIKKLMHNPWIIFTRFNYTKIQRLLSDEAFLKLMYRIRIGKRLNLKNPVTFNEKLQWLKLYDRKPVYTQMVDKYEAKKYIANIVGEQYVVPTYGVWNHFDEIDFDALPDSFVLKTTHDNGGVVLCRNKKDFDVRAAREKLEKRLKVNFYWRGREWPYKDVKPRIIAEELLTDDFVDVLPDYKFFCFNGTYNCGYICTDRFSKEGLHITFFDRNWEKLPFTREGLASDDYISRPKNDEKMIEIAEKLAANTKFLRVDFYEANGKLYVGELTFFPANGFRAFQPEEYDRIWGDKIDLKG